MATIARSPYPTQASATARPAYRTTSTSCSCPDFFYRSIRNPFHECKHMRALAALAACDWPAEAWCCSCQRRYAWTEESPLYCPDCRQQATASAAHAYYEATSRALLAFD